MLSARAVSFTIGRVTLVRDVSVEVGPGEVLAVIGPNGAGKSSLLRLLSGDRTPTAGQVTMAGRSLRQWRRRPAARVRAVMAQSTDLSFPFRVAEVVALGRAPHAGTPAAARDGEVVEAAMALADVAGLADREITTLSGGERQRTHLARVLAQIWDPPDDGAARYLLLDEPTASLDIAHQHAVLGAARRFADQGVAVLAVLHDFNLAAMYADRVAVMRDAALHCVGPPAEIFTPALFREVFSVEAGIIAHPTLDCPVVVPFGGSAPVPHPRAVAV